MKDLSYIAKKVFYFREWLDGSMDGGVTPPRILDKITSKTRDDGYVEFNFEYHYPKLSHPNTDVTYHVINPDNPQKETVVISDDGQYVGIKNSDDPFKEYRGWGFDNDINNFCKKYDIELLDLSQQDPQPINEEEVPEKE